MLIARLRSNPATAGRQPELNKACKFRNFGWYTPSTAVFFSPTSSSGLRPDVKLCQECFVPAVEPCAALASLWTKADASGVGGEETFVQCILGEARVQAAWLQSVQQADAAPFVEVVKRLDALDKQADEKCPCTPDAVKKYGSSRFWTLTNLPAEEDGRRFKMCEYHYAGDVKDTWMQGEFSQLPASQRGDGTCDYGSHPGAQPTMLFAQRNRNVKLLHDWAALYIDVSGSCRGYIGTSHDRYVLSGVNDFAACSTCYVLNLAAIPLAGSMFEKTRVTPRGRCVLAHREKASMWAVGLIKAGWKDDRQEFVNTARAALNPPPCPLLGDKDKMALQTEWYVFRSVKQKDMVVTICEACYLQHVLRSRLAADFSLQQPPYTEIAGCDLAHPGIKAAFDAGNKADKVAVFEQSLLKLLEDGGEQQNQPQSNSSSSQQSQQQQQQGGGLPDIDISRCRGAPQQIAALEQLQREVIALRQMAAAERNRARLEVQQWAFDESAAGAMRSAWGISGNVPTTNFMDGRGNWYGTRQEAAAGNQWMVAQQRQNLARARNAQLAMKTDELLRLKAQLMRRY